MSFTVVHHRGGKAIPIKLSIWDALKGSSSTKDSDAKTVSWHQLRRVRSIPKPTPCHCCNKNHDDPKTQAKPDKKNEAKLEDEGKGESSQTGKNASNNIQSNREEETYSAKDDAKIIEMKTSNGSWKQILEAINKTSLSQLKDHWKVINPANADNANDKKDDKVDTANQAKIDKQKAEGEEKRKERQRKEGDKSKSHSKNSKKAGATDKSDDLKLYAQRYDKQKWLAAASRHYDLTGQRISVEMAQKMIEGEN